MKEPGTAILSRAGLQKYQTREGEREREGG